MKLNKPLATLIAATALLLSSCGVSLEPTRNYNMSQTNVTLSRANFRIIGQVQGESSQIYILGIGGLSASSLRESATSEMYKNARLTGSQAIINTNIVNKSTAILPPLYYSTTAIATGTIIEFLPEKGH